MKIVKATLKGIVPMMHNRYPMRQPGEKGKQVEQTLEEKCFVDKAGVYLPTDNLRMMLIGNKFRKGAADIVGAWMESKNGREYKEFCKSCVWVVGPDDPMKVYVYPKRKKWDDVDVRSFITATGGRNSIARPLR
jgi:hypothetical protein